MAWLANSFSDDFLLTQASLYWFTNTISTSFPPLLTSTVAACPVSWPGSLCRLAVALFPRWT